MEWYEYPNAYRHYCESCDIAFATNQEYSKHVMSICHLQSLAYLPEPSPCYEAYVQHQLDHGEHQQDRDDRNYAYNSPPPLKNKYGTSTTATAAVSSTKAVKRRMVDDDDDDDGSSGGGLYRVKTKKLDVGLSSGGGSKTVLPKSTSSQPKAPSLSSLSSSLSSSAAAASTLDQLMTKSFINNRKLALHIQEMKSRDGKKVHRSVTSAVDTLDVNDDGGGGDEWKRSIPVITDLKHKNLFTSTNGSKDSHYEGVHKLNPDYSNLNISKKMTMKNYYDEEVERYVSIVNDDDDYVGGIKINGGNSTKSTKIPDLMDVVVDKYTYTGGASNAAAAATAAAVERTSANDNSSSSAERKLSNKMLEKIKKLLETVDTYKKIVNKDIDIDKPHKSPSHSKSTKTFPTTSSFEVETDAENVARTYNDLFTELCNDDADYDDDVGAHDDYGHNYPTTRANPVKTIASMSRKTKTLMSSPHETIMPKCSDGIHITKRTLLPTPDDDDYNVPTKTTTKVNKKPLISKPLLGDKPVVSLLDGMDLIPEPRLQRATPLLPSPLLAHPSSYPPSKLHPAPSLLLGPPSMQPPMRMPMPAKPPSLLSFLDNPPSSSTSYSVHKKPPLLSSSPSLRKPSFLLHNPPASSSLQKPRPLLSLLKSLPPSRKPQSLSQKPQSSSAKPQTSSSEKSQSSVKPQSSSSSSSAKTQSSSEKQQSSLEKPQTSSSEKPQTSLEKPQTSSSEKPQESSSERPQSEKAHSSSSDKPKSSSSSEKLQSSSSSGKPQSSSSSSGKPQSSSSSEKPPASSSEKPQSQSSQKSRKPHSLLSLARKLHMQTASRKINSSSSKPSSSSASATKSRSSTSLSKGQHTTSRHHNNYTINTTTNNNNNTINNAIAAPKKRMTPADNRSSSRSDERSLKKLLSANPTLSDFSLDSLTADKVEGMGVTEMMIVFKDLLTKMIIDMISERTKRSRITVNEIMLESISQRHELMPASLDYFSDKQPKKVSNFLSILRFLDDDIALGLSLLLKKELGSSDGKYDGDMNMSGDRDYRQRCSRYGDEDYRDGRLSASGRRYDRQQVERESNESIIKHILFNEGYNSNDRYDQQLRLDDVRQVGHPFYDARHVGHLFHEHIPLLPTPHSSGLLPMPARRRFY